MTLANLGSYFAQLAVLVTGCAALPRLLRLQSPSLQYLFWRMLLAVCILLPLAQPWRHEQMAFVPAPHTPGLAAVAAAGQLPSDAGSPLVSFGVIATVVGILLLVGIGARLAWLGAGLLRLRWMREVSAEPAGSFADLQQAIGATADIRWSHAVRHPVTFGLIRPVVLLPVALRAADESAQRAVAAHELHHVRRHDWLSVIVEEIVRSIFWFHQAMWWLVSRVQLARETVVDELSILTTNERRAYLDTLLAFADNPGLASTPAFSARHQLFYRVMLLSKEENMSPLRIAAGSCVLIAALGVGSWGVVRAFPLASVVVVPQVAVHANEVRDAAIHQAVLRWNKAQQDTSLSREQRLRLLQMGLLELDHALNIDPENRDALIWKNVMLRAAAALTNRDEARALMLHEADEMRDKATALEAQAAQPPATRPTPGQLPPPPPPPPPPARQMQAPPPPPPAGDMPESFIRTIERLHPIRIGDSVDPPKKLKDVRPIYPRNAMDAKVQGTVELEVIVDRDGAVADARVITGVPELNDATLDAVKQWAFTPTNLNGEPTAVIIRCTMTFTLR